jgi:hypothetical protein
MRTSVAPSRWKCLSFRRSDWLSVLLALAALAFSVAAILIALAYVLLIFYGSAVEI